MEPEAPGRFSTTTVCLRRSPSFWPTMRDAVSVGPPAGKGTTSRSILLGQPVSARAPPAMPASSGAAARARTLRRVGRAGDAGLRVYMKSPLKAVSAVVGGGPLLRAGKINQALRQPLRPV